MPHPPAVSYRTLLVAVSLGALPALLSSLLLRDPLPGSCLVAGCGLALAALPAWYLRRPRRLAPGTVLAFALSMAAAPTLIAALALDTTITNDERAYLHQAELFAAGSLAEPLPPEPELFLRRQLYSDEARGIRYAKYPPGTALALVPSAWVGWPLLSTLAAGLLDVLLVVAIARRLGLAAPAHAAVLLAVAPLFLLVQTSVQSEVFALPAVLAGYLCLLKLRSGEAGAMATVAFGALTGACAGFAFLCRPLTGVLAAIALGIGLLSAPGRARATLGAWLGGLPFAAAYLLYNHALTGDALALPYHLYALKYGPFDATGMPLDVYGRGDPVEGLLVQCGRWSVGFAGTLGIVALGFLGTWRLRARDGFAALLFSSLAVVAYAFHWHHGHKLYLGPLHCHESLGFLVCGALVVLDAAPERARRGILLAALCAGPAAFAIQFAALQELGELRSMPQRVARDAPPGAVILIAPMRSAHGDDPGEKYYTPSVPQRRPDERVVVREPLHRPLEEALVRAGLAGRPVFRLVADPGLRSGRLERVSIP